MNEVKPPKRRMIFFGDSITAGDGDERACGWPERLCVISGLTKRQMHCYNLGIGGDRISDIHARWRSETHARLAGKTGGYLSFMMGLNDAIKGAATDGTITFDRVKLYDMSADIISKAKELYPTILIEPTPVHNSLARADGALGPKINGLVMEICDMKHEISKELRVPIVQLTDILIKSDVFNKALDDVDRLHPSGSGHNEIANTIAKDPSWVEFIS